MTKHKTIRGVTLVEIAIVLVIIGLLLGGVLKGQELINNARVRAIADQQLGMQVAWNAFQDRYQAIPGDFPRAVRYIKRTRNGLGDGIIAQPSAGNASEMFLALNHLTQAGLLRCSECQLTNDEITEAPAAFASTEVDGSRGLRNTYGGIMGIFHDDDWYQLDSNQGSRTADNFILFSHTGPLVPSNILSEIDLKIDDGYANTGSFRYSIWNPTVADNGQATGAVGECTNQEGQPTSQGSIDFAGPTEWRSAARQPESFANCGGALAIQ